MINARAESLLDKPAFKRSFERRRCIVPADGFYEWEKLDAKTKQPWFITRTDGKPMAFAGLWESWRPTKGSDEAAPERRQRDERIRSCTIITGEPNELVARLHDRMPVMLPAEAWDAWLDPDNHDLGALVGLFVPVAPEELTMFPVSKAVNDVRNDGEHLVHRIDPGG